jgi:transposase-like protein
MGNRKYGSSAAGVISSMEAIEAERPWASQRTLYMADECSHCREELARLTEENAALRRAAMAFGSLAERLNTALLEERRARQPRHTTTRDAVEARADWGVRANH